MLLCLSASVGAVSVQLGARIIKHRLRLIKKRFLSCR